MVWQVQIPYRLNDELCIFGVLWLTIVFSNRDAPLHCDYDTQGEDIYSVKWYKASVPSLKCKMYGTFKTRWSSSSRVVKKYSDGFPRSLTSQLPFIRGLASGLTRCNFVFVLIPVFVFVLYLSNFCICHYDTRPGVQIVEVQRCIWPCLYICCCMFCISIYLCLSIQIRNCICHHHYLSKAQYPRCQDPGAPKAGRICLSFTSLVSHVEEVSHLKEVPLVAQKNAWPQYWVVCWCCPSVEECSWYILEVLLVFVGSPHIHCCSWDLIVARPFSYLQQYLSPLSSTCSATNRALKTQ